MLFDYGTPNYIQLIDKLNKFIDLNQVEINQNEELGEIASVLLDTIKESNLENLKQLNKLSLKYNNWNDVNKAINSNILSSCNSNLLNIYNSRDSDESPTITRIILESFYLTLFADIYEGSLIAVDPSLKMSLESYSNNLTLSSFNLSSDSLKRLHYLWYIIPREVFTKHLDQHLDDKVLKTVDKLQNNDNYIRDKLIKSEKLKSEIDLIERTLTKQKGEYNFVGLSEGFTTLKQQKQKELCKQQIPYYLGLLSILGVIVWKIKWTTDYIDKNSLNESIFITTTISTFLIIFLLLYFFKISLNNVKSLKSQILQIDLRLTLCQFIHNYNTETKDARENMKDSFDKFESVIFAPIMPTDERMPSTFDGLEQITKIIGEFKK